MPYINPTEAVLGRHAQRASYKRKFLTDAKQWDGLGREPHTRVNTELFDLVFHAGNLLDLETLKDKAGLADVYLLNDDYAPVDTLVFDVNHVVEEIR